MANFYERIYEIAKMDHESAKILSKNRMFPQSIYFYEQCFEKSLKAVISHYMSCIQKKTDTQIEKELRPRGHNIIEKTMDMMKLMIDEEVKLYLKRGGKRSDPFIQGTYEGIEKFIEHEYPVEYQVVIFYDLVVSHYDGFYARFYIPKYDKREEQWVYLRRTYSNPDQRHHKFMTLSWIISPILINMDTITRYPTPSNSLNNNNVSLLKDKKFLTVCNRLSEMLEDHMELVPMVWKATNKLLKR